MKPKRIVGIGAGGVGSSLFRYLAKVAAFHPELQAVPILVVDGDRYQRGNLSRQIVPGFGNKAFETSLALTKEFPELTVESLSAYVTGPNDQPTNGAEGIPVSSILKDGDWVLLCVDNHKTRLVVSQFCQTLRNVVLINGGNDFLDGSVQLFVRENGRNLTPTIEKYQPEIQNPTDKAPYEQGCEALLQDGNTQLVITNVMIAVVMLAKLWCLLEQPEQLNSVSFVDIAKVNLEGPFAVSHTYPQG